MTKVHLVTDTDDTQRMATHTKCGRVGWSTARCPPLHGRPSHPAEYDTANGDIFEGTAHSQDVTCGQCRRLAWRVI